MLRCFYQKTPTPNPSPIKREGLNMRENAGKTPLPSLWGQGPGDGGLVAISRIHHSPTWAGTDISPELRYYPDYRICNAYAH